MSLHMWESLPSVMTLLVVYTCQNVCASCYCGTFSLSYIFSGFPSSVYPIQCFLINITFYFSNSLQFKNTHN